MKKALLLNASHEVLNFITDKKALKLIVKEKVEILSSWDETIHFANGSMQLPAILRLKSLIRRNYFNSNFNRQALVKRDGSTCQYCEKLLSASQVTIDHVLPRSQNGITSFSNCVVACYTCNGYKGNRTPEQANMILLRKPVQPAFMFLFKGMDKNEAWHKEWNNFLGAGG